jgi:hypothetical protein
VLLELTFFCHDLAREAESSKQRKRKASPRNKAASKKGDQADGYR